MYAIASVTFICFKCGRVSSVLVAESSLLVTLVDGADTAVTGLAELTAMPFVEVLGFE